MEQKWKETNQNALQEMLQGNWGKAIELSQIALQQAIDDCGPIDISVVTCLNNLGEFYRMNGNFVEAEENLLNTFNLSKKVFGNTATEVTETLKNIISLYTEQERWQDVLPYMEEIVTIYDQSSKTISSIDQIKMIKSLAETYLKVENVDAAQPHLEQAFALCEKESPVNSMLAAPIVESLAGIDVSNKRFEEAQLKLRKALSYYEESCGPVTPEIARVLTQIAETHQFNGNLEVAEKLLQQALNLYQATLPKNSIEIAMVMEQLAQISMSTGNIKEAETQQRQAIKIISAADKDNREPLAFAQNSLAEMLMMNEKFDAALKLLLSSHKVRVEIHGETHAVVAQSLHNIGTAYGGKGNISESEKHHQQALSVRKSVFGNDHPAITQSLEQIAEIKLAQGQPAEAKDLLKNSLRIWEDTEGKDHPATARTWHSLAMVYIQQQKFKQAEQALIRAEKILNKTGGGMYLSYIYRAFSMLFDKMGDTARSREYMDKVKQLFGGGGVLH